MKQVGKIGRANAKANKKIEQIALEKSIYYCEVCPVLAKMGLLNWSCLQSHQNAHRHERNDYKHDLDKLYDFKQWVYSCQLAHTFIDRNKEVREKVFLELRGSDNLK